MSHREIGFLILGIMVGMLALEGFQLYHNFVRPHEALGGDTPADRAGIKVEGPDKFMTLIQNAQHQRRNREVR